MNSVFQVCFMAPLLLQPPHKHSVHANSGLKGTYFPDVVKVFEAFEKAAAISDSNNDSILECLQAERTAFDSDALTAVYTWTLKPQDGMSSEHPYFTGIANDESGYLTVFTNDDPTPREGAIVYSDYENCFILKIYYYGNRCLLGVQPELKDSVPQHCIDHFVISCGAVVPLYSRDLCYDGEGDY